MLQKTIINEKWLKEFSPLPRNYNMKEVIGYISIAEQIWLVPVIGQELYHTILEEVEEDKISKHINDLLVDAVYPLLGFAVVYEALPMIYSHISEVGITLGKSDNSDSISLKGLTYVQNHIRNQVEVRRDYLKFYLNKHISCFPEYFLFCNHNTPNKRKQVYGLTSRKEEVK